jgi:hypothetical protein
MRHKAVAYSSKTSLYTDKNSKINYKHAVTNNIYKASGVPRGGVWGVQPTPPKFRNFDKAEPNSQFRGKYIRNKLTRIRLSLIFLVVS